MKPKITKARLATKGLPLLSRRDAEKRFLRLGPRPLRSKWPLGKLADEAFRK